MHLEKIFVMLLAARCDEDFVACGQPSSMTLPLGQVKKIPQILSSANPR
jgi:hypothetical protein